MFSFEGIFLREFALKDNLVSLAFTESGDLLVHVTKDNSSQKILKLASQSDTLAVNM